MTLDDALAQFVAFSAQGGEAKRTIVSEIKRLQTELAENTDDSFRQIAHLCRDGPRSGWWDTCALSTAVELGDRLVELGTWEQHPDGYGRRWFYRPIKAAEASKGG